MSSGNTPSQAARWWGRFPLGVDESGVWEVGPLRMTLVRRRREWCVEREKNGEVADAASARVSVPAASPESRPGVERNRFSFAETPESVWVWPALADRAVVIYPESPFHVTDSESITLFCSSPLWVRIEVGESRLPLLDAPTDRPPDTWFGPSTHEGELCYATRTSARLDRESIPARPHRAVTELRIENHSSGTLLLERVNLSVPYLSVYEMPDGGLWTESVTLERMSNATMGRLKVGSPPEGKGVEKITGPRWKSESGGVLVRAFSALFD